MGENACGAVDKENTFIFLAKILLPQLQRRPRSENTNYHSSPYRYTQAAFVNGPYTSTPRLVYTQAAFVKIQIAVVRPIGTPLRDAMIAILYLLAQSAFVLLRGCVRAM